ncbi:hypothetical protein [Dokdonella koreensis]|uniref:Uncharacterized protein n=1 Tax=Dokdonella koreensis DS-123 TaxID=1300342 RepID=A0A167GQZ7_9GAMM|nr:hypothetical protein [Dokdonella koreensis]ANB17182.1 Hypothetical protein I596_1152 [Dokdonella koreensis DS-123]
MKTHPNAGRPRESSRPAVRGRPGRRRTLRWAGATGLALATALAFAAEAGGDAPAGATFRVTAHSIAGGAGQARNACFDLTGTIGQPVAGVSSGGDFTLTTGFLTGVRPDDSILRTSFEDCAP